MEVAAAIGQSRTTEEWEAYLGQQIRNLRIRSDLDQAQLASRADISIGALKNLEGGKGSSLKTLIKVVQALDRPDWLEALAPLVAVSPMQLLRAQAGQKTRLKVFRSRRSLKTGE
jgi:transcriptional regulator with XRE-family HTH domain